MLSGLKKIKKKIFVLPKCFRLAMIRSQAANDYLLITFFAFGVKCNGGGGGGAFPGGNV